MKTARLEAFLAKIYVDEKARVRFLTDPRGEAAVSAITGAEGDILGYCSRVDRVVKRRLGTDCRRIQRRLSPVFTGVHHERLRAVTLPNTCRSAGSSADRSDRSISRCRRSTCSWAVWRNSLA